MHAFVPLVNPNPSVTPILVKVTVVVPVLLTVTVCAALVVPTVCEPNAKLDGVRVIAPAPAVPVPVRATVSGPPPVCVTANDPVSVPVAVGLNVIAKVQLAAGARVVVLPHVPTPVATAKFAEMLNPVRLVGVVPRS